MVYLINSIVRDVQQHLMRGLCFVPRAKGVSEEKKVLDDALMETLFALIIAVGVESKHRDDLTVSEGVDRVATAIATASSTNTPCAPQVESTREIKLRPQRNEFTKKLKPFKNWDSGYTHNIACTAPHQ